jgi:hypothetical protein
MSQSHIECPICMDNVELNKNCVTTECGHCFHASCLMRNVAHNGFGCPYCRTAMAEDVEDEEDEEDANSEWSEDEESVMFDDYALRGLRFFTDNLEGIEHDEEDALEEKEDEEEIAEEMTEQQNAEAVIRPSPEFIAEKLVSQGVTMEQLVKALLINHREYEAEEEAFTRLDDDLFGRFRIIISNYETAQQVAEPEEQRLRTSNRDANVTVRRPMRA